MQMTVDQSRQDTLAVQIRNDCVLADIILYSFVISDINQFVSDNGNCRSDTKFIVNCVNRSI